MSNARKLADNLPTEGSLSGRNLIINGAMNVSQRHGTSSVQLSATEQYLVDRFFNDTGGSFNISADAVQSSDAPSGFANSLRISCDAVTTPSSTQNGCITTILEGQDCQRLAYGTSDAKDVTLSFYARSGSSNSGHTYGIMMGAFLNGTRSSQVKGFTVTDSWQRFTITFNGTGTVTSTAINDDINPGMQISFSLAAGSSDQVSYSTWTADTGLKGFTGQDNFFDNTSNKLYLTGVQLEVGDKATDFEHLSFGDELARCNRYYQKILSTGSPNNQMVGAGHYNTTTAIVIPFQYYGGPMRGGATGAVSSSIASFDIEPFDVAPSALSFGHMTTIGCYINVTDPSARTKGYAASLFLDTTGAFLEFDAEL